MTLDDDVINRVKEESRSRGSSFRQTVNDLLRDALTASQQPKPSREFRADPIHMGEKLFDFSYDCIPALLERLDGPEYK